MGYLDDELSEVLSSPAAILHSRSANEGVREDPRSETSPSSPERMLCQKVVVSRMAYIYQRRDRAGSVSFRDSNDYTQDIQRRYYCTSKELWYRSKRNWRPTSRVCSRNVPRFGLKGRRARSERLAAGAGRTPVL